MLNKALVIATSAGLLFATGGTAAQAQTWTEGTAYVVSPPFSLPTGPGQSYRNNPATSLRVNARYVDGLPQGGNLASGGGTAYQPYVCSGDPTKTALNITVKLGDGGSGSGSYHTESSVSFAPQSGFNAVSDGSAPPSYVHPVGSSTLDLLSAQNGGVISGNTCTF